MRASAHQFSKNFVGDSEALRGETHAIAIHFDKTLDTQGFQAGAHVFELIVQFSIVIALDAMQVDSFHLAQAEKKLFFERLLGA